MEKQAMIKTTAEALAAIKMGGKKDDAQLAALDRGILEVALMIAGLDGTILESEYEAFVTMAKYRRGATAASTKEIYRSAISKGGQISAMARSGLFSEAQRLETFVRYSVDALPKGFASGSLADVRRAFALWIAMGVSDGEFSEFERKCVKMLVRRFVLVRAGRAKRFGVVLESDFFAKAEKIFRDMAVDSRREKAEQALADLIQNVAIPARGSIAKRKSSSRSLPLPGPVITSWK